MTSAKNSSATRAQLLSSLQIFSIIFVAIFFLHGPLLRLPFFWDEAGFYVPAAYDLLHSHAVIPVTTIDTGHPPLPAAYLALWFALSGWKPAVARIAMLLVAAFGLTNVFLLARRVAGTGVASASTIATALYPIFFVQSSLTHADLPAAAFTLWGLRLALERRVWTSQLAFCLAVLSKETAVITPVVLAAWQIYDSRNDSLRNRVIQPAIRLLPVVLRERRVLPIQRRPDAESAALSPGGRIEAMAVARRDEHAGPHRRHGCSHALPAGR